MFVCFFCVLFGFQGEERINIQAKAPEEQVETYEGGDQPSEVEVTIEGEPDEAPLTGKTSKQQRHQELTSVPENRGGWVCQHMWMLNIFIVEIEYPQKLDIFINGTTQGFFSKKIGAGP